MKLLATSIIFLFILLAAGSLNVHACSCAWSTPATAFNKAEAVFIGKMLGGTEKLQEKDQNGKTYTIEAGSVKFAVSEVFKGSISSDVTIEVASMVGTSCGPYGLSRDQTYVVYAYRDRNNNTARYTGVCTRTSSLADAKEDLNFLRTLPPPGTGGKLEGRIWYDSRTRQGGAGRPMPGLKVTVRDRDNKDILLTTGENGGFEVENLKAGTYRVGPQMPQNFYIEKDWQTVEVADRGTATIGFEAYYTGKVIGRATDKNGADYNSIFLHLISTDENTNVYGHSTGKNGGFEFEGVPPGSYIIFLELQHANYRDDRPYYYPGTYDRHKATVLQVGLGEKIEDLKFTFPPEYSIRTIEGRVFWEDGTPAAGAEITLRCPTGLSISKLAVEFGAKRTETGDGGNFKLEVFAGETYWLHAEGVSKNKKAEEVTTFSKSKKILVSDSLKNERLILSTKNGTPANCP